MKNFTIKQPAAFSNRGRILIYSLGTLAIAFIIGINYYQTRMYNETIKNGLKFKTSIIKIDCSNGKSKSRLYIKDQKNELQHVNVRFSECINYQIGDTISVYVNQDKEWYVIDPLMDNKHSF